MAPQPMQEKYNYTRLEENGIRLLKIHPERRDDHVVCTLGQYSDNKNPTYDALSYYWGDPTRRSRVYLDDTLVSIHETLWEFLDQMQKSIMDQMQQSDERKETWIWVDYLCLNQLDDTELHQQIRRMGDIYSKAEKTISWLGCKRSPGPGPDLGQQDLGATLTFIGNKVAKKRAAVEEFFARPNLDRWTNIRKKTQLERHVLDVLRPSEADPTVSSQDLPRAIAEVQVLGQGHMSEAITRIRSLPYWERAWVTQEVALARRVVLMFGNVTLDFDDFFLAYKSHFYYHMKHCKPLNGELRVPIEARAAVRENHITFQQVMQWGRDCKASKEVDRIYGLLGLLARCGDGPGEDALPPILTGTIDYKREWSQVYWETVLTYRPIKDISVVAVKKYRRMLEIWVDFFLKSAEAFSCPVSSQSLQDAASERAPQSCRDKARTALRVIDVCRLPIGNDIQIRIKALPDDGHLHSHKSSWPTKPGARQLWHEAESGDFRDFQNLLATLFIDTDESSHWDENEEYQAVYMGLKILSEKWGGAWECEPHHNVEGSPVHNRSVSFGCQVEVHSQQPPGLPCSLSSATSSASPIQEAHQCKTQDRYLVIQSTGWRLSLEGSQPFGVKGSDNIQVARLTVKY